MKKVSFVIIAYNEEKLILNCINSILNQDGLGSFNYNIIIVNDGSKDKTGEIVKRLSNENLKIKLINLQTNKGRGYARYKGVERADGNYISFVDADITLPKIWLKTVFPYFKKYDAVGGIALPDGDSTYICQKFNLEPKILQHAFGITGSNAIYKKSVFDKITINPQLRGGEDTDFNLKMIKAGIKTKAINNLVVKHQEDIDFRKSLKRMYSFGKGATILLNKHKIPRIPDISFFMFMGLLIFSIISALKENYLFLILLITYPLIVSYLHIVKKFKINSNLKFILSGVINYFLICSYFFGRIIGFISKE